MKRQIVYESAPYRSKWGLPGRLWNVLQAVKDARRLSKQGYCVFIPHLWAFLDLFGRNGERFWLDCGLKMLPKCQVIRLRKGWIRSEGAVEEYQLALVLKMKVWFEGDEKPYPPFKPLSPCEIIPDEVEPSIEVPDSFSDWTNIPITETTTHTITSKFSENK